MSKEKQDPANISVEYTGAVPQFKDLMGIDHGMYVCPRNKLSIDEHESVMRTSFCTPIIIDAVVNNYYQPIKELADYADQDFREVMMRCMTSGRVNDHMTMEEMAWRDLGLSLAVQSETNTVLCTKYIELYRGRFEPFVALCDEMKREYDKDLNDEASLQKHERMMVNFTRKSDDYIYRSKTSDAYIFGNFMTFYIGWTSGGMYTYYPYQLILSALKRKDEYYIDDIGSIESTEYDKDIDRHKRAYEVIYKIEHGHYPRQPNYGIEQFLSKQRVWSDNAEKSLFQGSKFPNLEEMSVVRKYIRRKRRHLAQYFQVDTDHLEEALRFDKREKGDHVLCNTLFSYFGNPVGWLNEVREDVSAEYKDWDQDDNDENKDETPFLRNMIDQYYIHKLSAHLADMMDSGTDVNNLTELDIIRNVVPDTAAEDAALLKQSDSYASLMELFMKQRAMYYDSFLIKNQIGIRSSSSLLPELVRKKDAEIAEKDDKIAELIEAQTKAAAEARRREETILLGPEKELQRKDKKIEELTRQLNDLKARIAERDEYIKELETLEIEGSEETSGGYSLEELQKYKFVFVCLDCNNIYPELKRLFPNCIVVESETTKMHTKMSADLVVFVIRHISHPLYFHVLGWAQSRGIQHMFFNQKNLDTMLAQIQTDFVNTHC